MCHITVLNVSGWWHVINVIDIGEESGGSKILALLTLQQTLGLLHYRCYYITLHMRENCVTHF